MLPLPYTNAAAAALFVAACLVWIIPEAMGMRRQTAQISRQGAHRADRGSLVLLIGLQWVGLGLNFGLAATLPGASHTLAQDSALRSRVGADPSRGGMALVRYLDPRTLLYP